jgi:hypothetical protein
VKNSKGLNMKVIATLLLAACLALVSAGPNPYRKGEQRMAKTTQATCEITCTGILYRDLLLAIILL